MKKLATLVLALAACGGSAEPANSPPTPAPEPAAAAPAAASAAPVASEPAPAPKEKEPEPAPPPPPSLAGWYANAHISVVLADDGSATLVKKGKATKGKWDATASTLMLKGEKSTPIKLADRALVVAIDGADKTLPRQPSKFTGTTFANDNGSLQLNEDGTCIHGHGGIPEKCTYALVDGELTIKYPDNPKKKPAAWHVWFDETNKIMHTPKETLTATN
jgi:hypothetical protein